MKREPCDVCSSDGHEGWMWLPNEDEHPAFKWEPCPICNPCGYGKKPKPMKQYGGGAGAMFVLRPVRS